MSDKHSVPAQLLQSLFSCARHNGLDLRQVISKAGLDHLTFLAENRPEDSEQRVHLDDLGPLLRCFWSEIEDEASGFLSRPLKLGTFSMMCHALISAGNLRRCLLRGSRFLSLLTEDVEFQLIEKGDEARWIIHYKNPHQQDETFFVTSLFVIWIRLSCWMIDQPMLLDRIEFTFLEPDYEAEFSLMFPCPHYFSKNENVVVFNKRMLSLPIKQDSETLTAFLNHAPESLLTQFRSDDSLTAQVKRLLLHRQGTQTEIESLGFEDVSEELNMTTHTLRRRLKDEGNSYQEIKDSIRRDRALQLLDKPEIPLEEISMQLGFSEAAAFNRAFKKWVGVTPGAYRSVSSQKHT